MLIVFISSSIPGENFPKVDFEFSDKIVHLIIFAVLFVLFFYSLKNQTKYAKLQKFALEYSFLFTALYGITDELHQYFIPNRSCELYDWFADLTGALLIYLSFKIYISKKKSILTAVFLFTLCSCATSDTKLSGNENVKVIITQQEAWLNLMPVVDENRNNFGFLISLKIETMDTMPKYDVRDLKIYTESDSLINRKFSIENFDFLKGVKDISISQLNDERYLNKDKSLPEECQFSFSIYKDNLKIKTIKTSKLKINKVY